MQTVYTVGADNKALMRRLSRQSHRRALDRRAGPQAGERIVVEGLLKVRPGAAVEPQPYDDRKPGN